MKRLTKPWGSIKFSPVEMILFTLALPFIFIIATFGSAISALFSKRS